MHFFPKILRWWLNKLRLFLAFLDNFSLFFTTLEMFTFHKFLLGFFANLFPSPSRPFILDHSRMLFEFLRSYGCVRKVNNFFSFSNFLFENRSTLNGIVDANGPNTNRMFWDNCLLFYFDEVICLNTYFLGHSVGLSESWLLEGSWSSSTFGSAISCLVVIFGVTFPRWFNHHLFSSSPLGLLFRGLLFNIHYLSQLTIPIVYKWHKTIQFTRRILKSLFYNRVPMLSEDITWLKPFPRFWGPSGSKFLFFNVVNCHILALVKSWIVHLARVSETFWATHFSRRIWWLILQFYILRFEIRFFTQEILLMLFLLSQVLVINATFFRDSLVFIFGSVVSKSWISFTFYIFGFFIF